MNPGTVIDMSDKNAWDDSHLIKSWDRAVAEYKKYHSIHKSGKRLEDVLTKEELEELQEDYGDVLEATETSPEAAAINGDTDQQDADSSLAMDTDRAEIAQNEPETSEQKQQGQSVPAQPPATQEDPFAAAMPQAILGTVQDEKLKNMMMSWYYAGYYTGVYAGQQQASNHESSNEK